MKQLRIVSKDGKLLADSREVAEMINVRHSDLLEKINTYVQYLENGEFRSQDFFVPSNYRVEGNNKTYDCFLLTKIGCDMVANKMTGEKGVLFTATYVTKFEEMERQLTSGYNLPQNYKEALVALVGQVEVNEKLEQKIEQDKPKTLFADAVATSNDSILVGQLATILKQNGVNIGQTRLFNFLREEGYLCKSGDRRNLPTQKAMDLRLFEIKEFTVVGNTGSRVKSTPKVTGQGQIYFINKFLKAS